MLPRDHYLKQAFQDLVHFPNGFEKGGLSDIQARLVRKNGVLISALCMDEVSDPTPDDLHILKVIANQSAPKSPVEQAWVKYLGIVKTQEGSSPKAKNNKAKAKPVEAETEPAEKPAKATKAEAVTNTKEKAAPKEKAAAKEKAEPAKTTAKKAEPKKAEPTKAEPKKAGATKAKTKA